MYRSNHFESQNGVQGLVDPSPSYVQNPIPQNGEAYSPRAERVTSFSEAAIGLPSAELHSATATPPYFSVPGEGLLDEQISALFTAMGRASQLSQKDIATRLQTTGAVVGALESGNLNLLPDWEEISQVVERYASFMKVDERPILRRLREQLTEHYLSMMSRQKTNAPEPVHNGGGILAGEIKIGVPAGYESTSLMPMSDLGLKAFAAGSNPPTPPLPVSVSTGSSHFSGKNTNFGLQQSSSSLTARLESSSLSREKDTPKFGASSFQRLPNNKNGFENSQNHISPILKKPIIATSNYRDVTMKKLSSQYNTQMNTAKQYGAHQRAGFPPHVVGQMQQNVNGRGIEPQHFQQPPIALSSKSGAGNGMSTFTKIAANLLFVVILLVGFINWQPNRFWSGVDQLPKPIATSIYTIFEYVMPDPLALTYRMNWVHVENPRLRKADRLPVPEVKSLPVIDFSNLTTLP